LRSEKDLLQRDLGKPAEAEAAYRAALGIQERLVADFPAVPQYRRELASSLYNLACLSALSSAAVGKDASLPQADRDQLAERHAAQAVERLGQAQAAGFFKDPAKIEHLKKDADLDPLRSRDDFKKLLKELEEKAKTSAK
jgi:hypothetical protein